MTILQQAQLRLTIQMDFRFGEVENAETRVVHLNPGCTLNPLVFQTEGERV